MIQVDSGLLATLFFVNYSFYILKLLPNQGYCVQSADCYNSENLQKNVFAVQFAKLFIEESPDLRIEFSPTLDWP
jgi:hypothetical protein